MKRYIWRTCHRDFTTQLAQQVRLLQNELARINRPSLYPGVLTAATLSAARDNIYAWNNYVNLIGVSNKIGFTGKALAKPTQQESNRTSKFSETNTIHPSILDRDAHRFARFFLDPEASIANITLSSPPPLEPKKPKPEPNSATAVVGIVPDVLSAKESKLKALMPRAGRPALAHYKEGKSGYCLIDSDNAFIFKEYVCFMGKFATSAGLADEEEALARKAKELHAKSTSDFEVIMEAYRKEWAARKEKQRLWKYGVIMQVAQIEEQAHLDGTDDIVVRWPAGIGYINVVGKPLEQFIGAEFDDGYLSA